MSELASATNRADYWQRECQRLLDRLAELRAIATPAPNVIIAQPSPEQIRELATLRTRSERMERALREMENAVPTNWLDPILTGAATAFSAGRPATANVESVLRAVKERIAAIAREALEKGE